MYINVYYCKRNVLTNGYLGAGDKSTTSTSTVGRDSEAQLYVGEHYITTVVHI